MGSSQFSIIDSPTELPCRRYFNNRRIAVSQWGTTFILRIFGIDLLAKLPELLCVDHASFALEHDTPDILPCLGVVIEDDGHVGIHLDVTHFSGAPLRAEIDLVILEQRTHRNIMRNTV